uniref:Uncharacterized protein n=1 Tax=Kalanchoe fedtschenkoi TaxID=63787 RepID=A0A7N0V838_KALFE
MPEAHGNVDYIFRVQLFSNKEGHSYEIFYINRSIVLSQKSSMNFIAIYRNTRFFSNAALIHNHFLKEILLFFK